MIEYHLFMMEDCKMSRSKSDGDYSTNLDNQGSWGYLACTSWIKFRRLDDFPSGRLESSS